MPQAREKSKFLLVKMEFKPLNAANRDGTVIYRSGMNPRIHCSFQLFTPCDFIAAITQPISDKSFQLVRYYGWYSNQMRGQRNKQSLEGEEAESVDVEVEIIDVSEHQPRRIPSKKWRDLIKKVWEADPLICPDYDIEPVLFYVNA